jgi:hypothetical protein
METDLDHTRVLYEVSWMLISWCGMRTELVMMNHPEKEKLEEFFKEKSKNHQIFSYKIVMSVVMNKDGAIQNFEEDLKLEEESVQSDGNSPTDP